VARNEQVMKASPEAVFDVLADPRGYAYWVLGSMEIREADDNWPQSGTKFHHTVGAGPLRVKDHTVVEEVERNRYLQIEAKTRPFGSARVKLELEPAEGGTRVTMVEDPANRATAFIFMPLTHVLMRGRNLRSLDRLAELAEGRKPMPGEETEAPERTTDGQGSVENPDARDRRRGGPAALVAGGLAALALAALGALLYRRHRG
jgi:uncharacterized protein YndB with AHSA1/START domain